MSDDEIIRQRIAGKSVRAIAKAQRTAVTAVNEAVDRWAANVRQQAAVLELARLVELQKVFYERAPAATSRVALWSRS